MPISFDPLWETIATKRMRKSDLETTARISRNVIAKMGKNEPVSLQALEKICIALQCDVGDVIAIFPDRKDLTDE